MFWKKSKDEFPLKKLILIGYEAEDLTAPNRQPLPIGRISPQISCTVAPEDKLLLNEITMHAINKAGKPLNTSTIIRALIRLGYKMKDELEF